MIRADQAIARFRRDVTLSMVLKGLLVGGAVVAMVFESFIRTSVISGPMLLAAVGVIWVFLSYRSVRGSRMVAESPALIAAGQFERAEHHIGAALNSFSLFRTMKVRTLHHLAILRHAQRRWTETVLLCRALLGERLNAMGTISRSTRLILADSLLETGDVRGAHDVLASLHQQKLNLNEALELSCIQTDYLSRVRAWAQMLEGIRHKAEMAELMPVAKSARTQALLALAAQNTGRKDWENFLRRRAELIAGAEELMNQRPLLRELWREQAEGNRPGPGDNGSDAPIGAPE